MEGTGIKMKNMIQGDTIMKKIKLNISTSIKNCSGQIVKSIKPVQIIYICFFLCQPVFSLFSIRFTHEVS